MKTCCPWSCPRHSRLAWPGCAKLAGGACASTPPPLLQLLCVRWLLLRHCTAKPHCRCCWPHNCTATALQELMVDRDRSSLFYVARALHQLQQRWGTIAHVKGKGDAAAAGGWVGGRMGGRADGWVGGWVRACCLPAWLPACAQAVLLVCSGAGAGCPNRCSCLFLPAPALPCRCLLPAAVQRIMSRMRQEQGREAPAAGGGSRVLACCPSRLASLTRRVPVGQRRQRWILCSAALCCAVLWLS